MILDTSHVKGRKAENKGVPTSSMAHSTDYEYLL